MSKGSSDRQGARTNQAFQHDDGQEKQADDGSLGGDGIGAAHLGRAIDTEPACPQRPLVFQVSLCLGAMASSHLSRTVLGMRTPYIRSATRLKITISTANMNVRVCTIGRSAWPMAAMSSQPSPLIRKICSVMMAPAKIRNFAGRWRSYHRDHAAAHRMPQYHRALKQPFSPGRCARSPVEVVQDGRASKSGKCRGIEQRQHGDRHDHLLIGNQMLDQSVSETVWVVW